MEERQLIPVNITVLGNTYSGLLSISYDVNMNIKDCAMLWDTKEGEIEPNISLKYLCNIG